MLVLEQPLLLLSALLLMSVQVPVWTLLVFVKLMKPTQASRHAIHDQTKRISPSLLILHAHRATPAAPCGTPCFPSYVFLCWLRFELRHWGFRGMLVLL